jgi:hypothetical protein
MSSDLFARSPTNHCRFPSISSPWFCDHGGSSHPGAISMIYDSWPFTLLSSLSCLASLPSLLPLLLRTPAQIICRPFSVLNTVVSPLALPSILAFFSSFLNVASHVVQVLELHHLFLHRMVHPADFSRFPCPLRLVTFRLGLIA